MSQGVVLFHTTTSALRSERILQKAGLNVKLIPTPRELSSDCGVAVRFESTDQEEVENLLKSAGVEVHLHLLP